MSSLSYLTRIINNINLTNKIDPSKETKKEISTNTSHVEEMER